MEYGRLALYINVNCAKTASSSGNPEFEDVYKCFTYNEATEYGMPYTTAVSGKGSCRVSITPAKIDISKSIGCHNTVDVCLKVKNKDEKNTVTLSDLKTAFMDRPVKIQLQNKSNEQWSDKYAVAENYRVVEVRPCLSKDADKTFYVNLLIFSSDVLMDMTPYSRAYTARKLGGDILAGIVSKYDDLKSAYNVSGLRVLKYVSSDGNVNVELRLPYVVQYNETEYDFILRNANRCGEFLYFENGKLILGLPNPVSVTEVSDYASIESVASGSPKDSAVAYAHGAVHDSGAPGDKTCLAEYANDDWFSVIQKDCYDAAKDRKNELNPPNWSRIVSQVFQYVNLSTSIMDIGFSEASLQNLCAGLADDDNRRISGKCFYYSECFGKDEEKEWKKIKKLCKKDKDPGYLAEDAKWQYAKSGKTWLHTQFSDFYTTKGNDSGCAIPDSKKDKIDSKTVQNSLKGTIPSDRRPITAAFYEMLKKEKEAERQQYRITFSSSCHGYRLGDIVKVSAIDANARFVVVAVESELHGEKNDITSVIRTKSATSETILTEPGTSSELVNRMTITVISANYTAATETAGESYRPVPLPVNMDMVRRVGSMTAVVTDSEDPLRLGRVRVRFHWQKATDDATPWIRVATPFATKDDSGMQFNLVKDDEVMVGFESENVERPYVEGVLYNSTNTPPFGQRHYSMVLRSRNGQTVGFRDTANAGNILTSFIPGIDFLKFIPQIATMNIDAGDNLKTRRAMGQIDITDYYGLYSISASSDQRRISIDSPFGTESVSAAMGITIAAPNGDVKIVGKNVEIVAGNNLTLKSGTNIDEAMLSSVARSVSADSWDPMKKAGKQGVKAIADKIAGIFDLPALRFALELVIKPVAGTLKVHSGRYLILEAGKGEALIPPAAYKERAGTVAGDRYDDIKSLIYRIELFASYERNYCRTYANEYQRISREKKEIYDRMVLCKQGNGDRKGILLPFISNFCNNAENRTVWREVYNTVYGKVYENDADIDDAAGKKTAKSILKELNILRRDVASFRTMKADNKRAWEPSIPKDLPVKVGQNGFDAMSAMRGLTKYPYDRQEGDIYDFNTCINKREIDGVEQEYSLGDIVYINIVDDERNPNYHKVFRKFTRENAVKCLKAYGGGILTFPDPAPDFGNYQNYIDYINGITLAGELTDNSAKDYAREVGLQILGGLFPYDITNVTAWEENSGGAILMSETEGHTIRIEGNGFKLEDNTLCNLKDVMKAVGAVSRI